MKRIVQYVGLLVLLVVALGLAGYAGSRKGKESQRPLEEIKSSPNSALPAFAGGTAKFAVSKDGEKGIRPVVTTKIRLTPTTDNYPRRWDIYDDPYTKTVASDSYPGQWTVKLTDDASAVYVAPPRNAKGKYSISITGGRAIQDE